MQPLPSFSRLPNWYSSTEPLYFHHQSAPARACTALTLVHSPCPRNIPPTTHAELPSQRSTSAQRSTVVGPNYGSDHILVLGRWCTVQQTPIAGRALRVGRNRRNVVRADRPSHQPFQSASTCMWYVALRWLRLAIRRDGQCPRRQLLRLAID
jgi:hypothetical protein